MAIDQNVVTDWVKANGMGGIDPARYESYLALLDELPVDELDGRR